MGPRKDLILIRGLQGSGKTTLARFISRRAEDSVHLEADQWFSLSGEYKFNPAELPKAHAWCQEQVRFYLTEDSLTNVVIVSNTFSQMWELRPYLDMAEELGARVTILTVETTLSDDELAARNVHNCPVEAIARLRNRWECFTRKDGGKR